jgi:uncharacterized Fe-S center protein
MLVLTHFKGHSIGGFGGSLKNIAIGCAPGKVGKKQLHSEGSQTWAGGPNFMERMVEGGKVIVVDMAYALPEAQRHDLVERIESRSGLRQLEYMKILNMGNDQYEIIDV